MREQQVRRQVRVEPEEGGLRGVLRRHSAQLPGTAFKNKILIIKAHPFLV